MPEATTSFAPDESRRFIDIFHLAARQAGCVARRLQDEVGLHAKQGARSAESAALTSVDLATQDIILLALHAAFPEAAVDAEEETATVGLFPRESADRAIIVIDPVDGTLNYGEGSRDYAVMGAWIEAGRYRAALVHFPHSGDSYWAFQGDGCRVQRNGRNPVAADIGRLPERMLVTAGVPEEWRADLRAAGFEVIVSRCSAVDATAPITGRAAGALTPGRPDRRRAVGFLPTVEAGGVVWIGDRWWQGEDPATLEGDGVTLVADSRRTVERVSRALDRHLTAAIGP